MRRAGRAPTSAGCIGRSTRSSRSRKRRAPRSARWDRLWLRPPARFLRSWIIGRGVAEGFPGFFVALQSAFYVHVKHAKADERWREEQLEEKH